MADVFPLAALPTDLLLLVLDALPLDAACRACCVARAWRAAVAASPSGRWAALDLSAAATARWRVPRLTAAAAAGALAAAAAATGVGARSVDITGQQLSGAWLFDACGRESARPGGGALQEL